MKAIDLCKILPVEEVPHYSAAMYGVKKYKIIGQEIYISDWNFIKDKPNETENTYNILIVAKNKGAQFIVTTEFIQSGVFLKWLYKRVAYLK